MPEFQTRLILTDHTDYANAEEARKAAEEWAQELRKGEMCAVEIADVTEQE